jgi:hypothetical protein
MQLNGGSGRRAASSADKLSVEWTSCLGQTVACGESRKGWIAFKSPVHEAQAGQASPGSRGGALYNDPDTLIRDEATSHLGNEPEDPVRDRCRGAL